jgi:glutathione peroxidase
MKRESFAVLSLVAGVACAAMGCNPQPAATKESTQVVATAASAASAAPAPSPSVAPSVPPAAPSEKTMSGSIYDFTLDTIDGTPRSLADFRGKVLLLVNVASECGYTPQYEGLQKLHTTYEARGFSVVGFPSNDFGGQEPGSNKDIKTFCTTKFHVTFPMFAKIPVKGPEKHPLYAMLVQTPPAGEVKWNFNKFLVGKDGKVIARFDSDVTPDSPELKAAIDKALGG